MEMLTRGTFITRVFLIILKGVAHKNHRLDFVYVALRYLTQLDSNRLLNEHTERRHMLTIYQTFPLKWKSMRQNACSPAAAVAVAVVMVTPKGDSSLKHLFTWG